MTTLYEIIKAVQDAPKKGGHKQAILEQHKDNELLQAYLKAVYDPRINYYMTKLPDVKGWAGEGEFEMRDILWLQNLSDRIVTGTQAKSSFAGYLSALNEQGRELMGYIIKRDIKAGIAEGTVLDVWPDLFFIPAYQRCSKMTDKIKAKFAKLPYFFCQSKEDGQFSYMIKRYNEAPVNMSRAGSIYPTWLSEKLAVGLPDGFVLAGEMLVHENGKILNRQEGNGILNSILSGDGKKFNQSTISVHFVAWDMLTTDEFDNSYSSREYKKRLEQLDKLLTKANIRPPCITLVNTWKVKSIAEAMKIQNEHLARKEEGTVWKAPDMLWRDCQSGDPLQVKAKLVFEADFKITGIFEGEGKYAGMCGGFNVETSDGLIKFNVGTGLSDAQRAEYWANDPTGKIAAIEGNDIVTSEGKSTESVFLPVLVEVREDKKVADTRDEVWAAFNAARGL